MNNFFRSRGVEKEEGTCNLRHNADPGSPRQRGSITASREEAVLETTVWEVLVDRTECFRACTKKRNQMWMPQLAQHKHLKIDRDILLIILCGIFIIASGKWSRR